MGNGLDCARFLICICQIREAEFRDNWALRGAGLYLNRAKEANPKVWKPPTFNIAGIAWIINFRFFCVVWDISAVRADVRLQLAGGLRPWPVRDRGVDRRQQLHDQHRAGTEIPTPPSTRAVHGPSCFNLFQLRMGNTTYI
eukprot:COSAG05_NODE_324_length_11401_cov_6.009379_13_plen_141_part_00